MHLLKNCTSGVNKIVVNKPLEYLLKQIWEMSMHLLKNYSSGLE